MMPTFQHPVRARRPIACCSIQYCQGLYCSGWRDYPVFAGIFESVCPLSELEASVYGV